MLTRRETSWRWLGAVVCAIAAGCRAPSLVDTGMVRHSKAPDFHAAGIRRVVVAPFHHPEGNEKASDTATEAFVQKLQEAGRFEVVYERNVSAELAEEVKLWVRGQVNVATLASASTHYQADAFCFGAITQYRAYNPPVLGLKTCLVATGTGEVVWQADGVFDAKLEVVADAARGYYKRRYQGDNYFMDADVMLKSMKHFAEFVSDEMVATLDDTGTARH